MGEHPLCATPALTAMHPIHTTLLGKKTKIGQVLTDFIQYHSYVSSSALLQLYNPVFTAFSQTEIRIPPFAAAEPKGYPMQHAVPTTPVLKTPAETSTM